MTRVAPLAIVTASLLSACGKSRPPKDTNEVAAVRRDAALSTTEGAVMQPDDDLQAVRNDLIQFASYRPPGAPLPTRGRKIKVIAPPEAVRLARSGDIHVIDRLLPLLTDPNRAWAAQVMLAAITGHDSDLVLDYERDPNDFFNDFGNGLKGAWVQWLAEVRDKLQWDESLQRFVVK